MPSTNNCNSLLIINRFYFVTVSREFEANSPVILHEAKQSCRIYYPSGSCDFAQDDGRVRDALNIAIIKSASKNLILIIVKFINFYEWKIFANTRTSKQKAKKSILIKELFPNI